MIVEKQVTVEDTGGKKWKLTLQGDGVKIQAPPAWKVRPIPFDVLREALNELGAA